VLPAGTVVAGPHGLYTGHRYHWTHLSVGLSLMFVGVLSGIVQAGLVRRIVPALGEKRAVILGMTISMCAQISYGLATQAWMVYAIMTVGAFAGIATPALQSYITQHVPPDEQGAAQGVYAGLGSLAGIPAPIIATWAFGWAISPESPAYVPGIAFFIAAAIIAVALALTVRAFRQDHRPTA